MATEAKLKAGTAPEALGLVNMGIPAPVPPISGEGRKDGTAERETLASPCLGAQPHP
jgi:hypothetical protein